MSFFFISLTLPACYLNHILQDDESLVPLCIDVGTCHYTSGKYELAISFFEEALRIISLVGKSVDAEILYKIASCHDSLCNYDKGKMNLISHVTHCKYGLIFSFVASSAREIPRSKKVACISFWSRKHSRDADHATHREHIALQRRIQEILGLFQRGAGHRIRERFR